MLHRPQVDGLDATIAAAVEKAENALRTRLNGEFDLREKLSQKDFDGDRKVLEARLAALQSQNDALMKQLEDVTARQEKAYAQVQDIATKAVANCGKTVIAARRLRPLPPRLLQKTDSMPGEAVLNHLGVSAAAIPGR